MQKIRLPSSMASALRDLRVNKLISWDQQKPVLVQIQQ